MSTVRYYKTMGQLLEGGQPRITVLYSTDECLLNGVTTIDIGISIDKRAKVVRVARECGGFAVGDVITCIDSVPVASRIDYLAALDTILREDHKKDAIDIHFCVSDVDGSMVNRIVRVRPTEAYTLNECPQCTPTVVGSIGWIVVIMSFVYLLGKTAAD